MKNTTDLFQFDISTDHRHNRTFLRAPKRFEIKRELKKLKLWMPRDQLSRKEFELDEILTVPVRRGLFGSYLKIEGKFHWLLHLDELMNIFECPSVAQMQFGWRKYRKKYFDDRSRYFSNSINIFTEQEIDDIVKRVGNPTEENQEFIKEVLSHKLNLCKDVLSGFLNNFLSSKYGDYIYYYDMYATRIISPNDFDRLRIIGKGGFGRVHCIRMKTGMMYALKEIHKTKVISKNRIAYVVNEAKILRKCDSTFICRLHHAFCDDTSVYFVLDLMQGGELQYHVRNMPEPQKRVVQFWMACLVIAISYIHEKKIIHRDIKLSNAILDEEGYVGLTDFGLSVTTDDGTDPYVSNCCGTVGYIAPEMYLCPRTTKQSSSDLDMDVESARGGFMSRIGSMRSSMKSLFGTRTKSSLSMLSGMHQLHPQPSSRQRNILEHKPGIQEEATDGDRSTVHGAYTSAVQKTVDSDVNKKLRENFAEDRLGSMNFDEAALPVVENYSYSVDWFGLGVILHQIYNQGFLPFSRGKHKRKKDLLANMLNKKVRFSQSGSTALIRNSAMVKEEGFESGDLLGMTPSGLDLIMKLLHPDPKQRIGCGTSSTNNLDALKKHPFFDGIDWHLVKARGFIAPFVPSIQAVNADMPCYELDQAIEQSIALAKKTKDQILPTHQKVFDELAYCRPESFYEELQQCEHVTELDSQYNTEKQCNIM